MTGQALASVLVTGANGQLGQSFRWLAPEALVDGIKLIFTERAALDIADADAVARFLAACPVQAVVNAAAHTAVDRAESEPAAAARANALGPEVLAQACRARGIALLHVSTDYVFDGYKTELYTELDPTHPLGVYGRTKLEGEQRVQAADPDALILRTGWVFSQFGHNFLKTMLKLGAERTSLAVVADQRGGPTYAPAIARVLLRLLRQRFDGAPPTGGIYHFGGFPQVSWCEFAQAIFAEAVRFGLLMRAPEVRPITTAEYPTAAMRPRNARLSCVKLGRVLEGLGNDWRPGLAAALGELQKRANARAE
ncbi:MAG: dTDP-4-dehydrorhamnose reductase [Gammaproteobacteria bacterium]|nr:dTDP-4-dehydrorhamnose reductase [Gammaproteobacteria bacterium]